MPDRYLLDLFNDHGIRSLMGSPRLLHLAKPGGNHTMSEVIEVSEAPCGSAGCQPSMLRAAN